MSGSKLLVDTNIIIYLLSGDQTLAELLDGKTIYVSFVTQLELLSYSALSHEEEEQIADLLSQCVIIDINLPIKEEVIRIRKLYQLKLPDSIIAATATYLDLPIITADQAFQKVTDLQLIYYEKS